MAQYLWKSMSSGLKSDYDQSQWAIGIWRVVEPPQKERTGLNTSKRIIDAMTYVDMEILAEVEAGGRILKSSDHWTCEKMRIIKAWKWRKEDSVELAFYASGLVFDRFKKQWPKGKRATEAIDLGWKWFENPLDRVSRGMVGAAMAMVPEAEKAGTAAVLSVTAAGSCLSAAAGPKEAARLAVTAVVAAQAASAWTMTGKIILDKCEAFIRRRIKTLEEIYSPERKLV